MGVELTGQRASMGLDFVTTVMWGTQYQFGAWGSANQGRWQRVITGGTISSIRLQVTTQSGNICVAVYRGSGDGLSRVPDQRVATSGSIACPAVGDADVSLGASVSVSPGDFLYMGCDNATAAFAGSSSGNVTNLHAGALLRATSAFPAPATASGLVADSFRQPLLVGVA